MPIRFYPIIKYALAFVVAILLGSQHCVLAGGSGLQSASIAQEKIAQEKATEKNELARPSDWEPATVAELKSAIDQWSASGQLAPEQIETIARHQETVFSLTEENRPTPLDFAIQIIAIGKPEWAAELAVLDRPRNSVAPPTLDRIIDAPSESEFVRNHVRLLLGRWLTQNEFYDEALVQLDQLELNAILDRPTLLFYSALAQHQLLKKEACIETLERLLQHEDKLPQRFSVVSKMMLADLKPLKPDSLDEISRLMNDIRRRTGFQRSGKIVLNQESEVIDKLDKLIEQLEAQQQQQQASGQSSGGSKPMQDSQSTQTKGSGKVANKELPEGGDWGDLPPARRAAALAEMAKDMPPHYRAAIEEYLRKLANEGNQ